jgi:hypothetical protein
LHREQKHLLLSGLSDLERKENTSLELSRHSFSLLQKLDHGQGLEAALKSELKILLSLTHFFPRLYFLQEACWDSCHPMIASTGKHVCPEPLS